MSVFKRKNSKNWWMKFTFNGQLIQQSTKVANKKDAETVERAYRTQLALGAIGIKPKAPAPTIKQACDDYLANVRVQHPDKQQTIDRYTKNVNIILKYFGNVKVDEIEPKQVENFKLHLATTISQRTKRNLKPKTINHVLLTLKMIFNRLVDFDVLNKSPAKNIKILDVPKTQAKILTVSEQQQYLSACHPKLKEIAILMIELGMRPSEILNLKCEDISLNENLLEVKEGKTKNANRVLPLTEASRAILQNRLGQIKDGKLYPDLYIVLLDQWHVKALKVIGIERGDKNYFVLYKLRHCFATRHAEQGTDIITLSELLGHGDLKTLKVYAQPSLEHKKAAMQKVEIETKERLKIANGYIFRYTLCFKLLFSHLNKVNKEL